MNSTLSSSKTKFSFKKNLVIIAITLTILSILIFAAIQSISSNDKFVNQERTSLVSSSRFSVDKTEYRVDEPLFFTGNGIGYGEYGEAHFIKPNGELHHKVVFDGKKNPALNHYFTPAPKNDVENCPKCSLIGTWTISFKMYEGNKYQPIQFNVIEEGVSN